MLPDLNPVGGNKYLFLIGYIISDMILISNKIYKIRILQIWGMETEYHKTQECTMARSATTLRIRRKGSSTHAISLGKFLSFLPYLLPLYNMGKVLYYKMIGLDGKDLEN